ncbi:MAG: hypothetical protein ABI615_02065 [Chthoniobacterales bacterium]
MDDPTMQAYVQVAAMEYALQQYYKEYGAFPEGKGSSFLHALMGGGGRKIDFLHVPAYAPRRGGVSNGSYLDPWGSPYQVNLSRPGRPLIFSPGPNKKVEINDPNSDDIRSWQ